MASIRDSFNAVKRGYMQCFNFLTTDDKFDPELCLIPGGLYRSLVNYKDFKYKPLNHASAFCAFGVDINRPILAPSGESLPSRSNSLQPMKANFRERRD